MYGNVMPCKELDLQAGFHSNYNHNQKIHQLTNQCHKMDEGVYPMVIERLDLPSLRCPATSISVVTTGWLVVLFFLPVRSCVLYTMRT